ncbi:transporter substrate-binding domain-containing protein [Pseudoalteromonas sp. MMG024]|uniref:substrate-binding periplasmic protein n=1 Tax=Pseudoalteromonas sp. MMG024 TaxID=2909980 RepID=UPI0031BBC2EB|nr:transporter substrate-binding domain-containing protein [Pseudoalteromonas sp. MMG024]
MKIKFYCFLSLLLFSTCCVSQQKEIEPPIRWATDSWPNYTDKDGSGLYHELMSSVFHSGHELNVQYAPWLRALELVKSGNADFTGAMPLNSNYVMSQHIVLSQPISVLIKKAYLDSEILTQLPELVGVWRSGYRNELLSGELKSKVKGVPTESTESGFNLVRHNRVDYLIDVRTILTTHLAKQPDKSEFELVDIGSLNLYMAFSKSERGKRIAKLFDSRVTELKKSGKLAEIYNKYQQTLPSQL